MLKQNLFPKIKRIRFVFGKMFEFFLLGQLSRLFIFYVEETVFSGTKSLIKNSSSKRNA